MRTWGYNVNKSSALWECFSRNTADTRCMRNTANFYIRNVMTGLRTVSYTHLTLPTIA